MGGQTKAHRFWQNASLDKPEQAAVSQDLAQKLINSMPGQIAEVLGNKNGPTLQIWLFTYTQCGYQEKSESYKMLVIILQYIIETSNKKWAHAANFVKSLSVNIKETYAIIRAVPFSLEVQCYTSRITPSLFLCDLNRCCFLQCIWFWLRLQNTSCLLIKWVWYVFKRGELNDDQGM